MTGIVSSFLLDLMSHSSVSVHSDLKSQGRNINQWKLSPAPFRSYSNSVLLQSSPHFDSTAWNQDSTTQYIEIFSSGEKELKDGSDRHSAADSGVVVTTPDMEQGPEMLENGNVENDFYSSDVSPSDSYPNSIPHQDNDKSCYAVTPPTSDLEWNEDPLNESSFVKPSIAPDIIVAENDIIVIAKSLGNFRGPQKDTEIQMSSPQNTTDGGAKVDKSEVLNSSLQY